MGCGPQGLTGSDAAEATWQQQQQHIYVYNKLFQGECIIFLWVLSTSNTSGTKYVLSLYLISSE